MTESTVQIAPDASDFIGEVPRLYKRLPVNILKVHPYVQRDVREVRLQKLRDTWNPSCTGELRVVPRDDGSYLVFDGHHRLVVMREKGYREAHCVVYLTEGNISIEAELCYYHNETLNWLPISMFKNRLAMKEPRAKEIEEAVKAGGGVIGGPNGFSCIATLEKIQRSFALGTLTTAVSIIEKAWPAEVKATSSLVVEGVARFHDHYEGKYSQADLISRLQYRTTLGQMLAKAKAEAKYERTSVPAQFVREMRRWYNHGARNRLPEPE